MTDVAVTADQVHSLLAANNATLDDLDPHDPNLNYGALDRGICASALAAYARLNRIHPNVSIQEKLQASGLHSSSHIAAIPKSDFVANYAPTLGLAPDAAEALHAGATDVSERALHMWASVHSAVYSPYFRHSRVNPTGADFVKTFEKIPSYQDMFGSLDYCECADCQSIFGPAAYFVDIMRMTEAYITRPNKITGRFSLAGRRPDLEKIPLSCSATNDVVPYLQIVNERLSDALRTDRPGVESDATEANAITQASNEDLMRFIAQKWKFPFGLPYNHLLEQLRTVIAHAGVTVEAIYRSFGAGETASARDALGLSKDEADMLSQSHSTPQDVAPYYGVAAGALDTLAEVSRLRLATGMSVTELDQLLFQDLTADEIAAKAQANFFINQSAADRLLNLDQSAPPDRPRIAFLDAAALDRINRFVRLARRLGWDFITLDWMLRSVAEPGPPAIGDGAFVQLARIKSWAGLFDCAPGDLAILFGSIKTYGAGGPEGVTPFDARFNTADLLARFDRYNPRSPGSWKPGTPDTADITRLLPGLGMSLEAVTALAQALWPHTTPVTLDLASLSALVRHGLLRRLFDLPMAAYLRLLAAVGAVDQTKPTGDELAALIAAWQWITKANLDINELDYVRTGVPNAFADPMYDADQASVSAWLDTVRQTVTLDANAEKMLVAQLATYFAQDAAVLGLVCAVAARSLADPANWPKTILTAAKDDPAVAGFLRWVSRWLMLRDRLHLDTATLQGIAGRPDAFGLDLRSGKLPFGCIAELGRLQDFVQSCHDRNGSILAATVALAAPPVAPAVRDRLADATGWPTDQIPVLLAAAWWPGKETAATQIMRLAECFSLLRRLGADASFAQRLAELADATASANWDDFKKLASLTIAKVSSLYEQGQWREIYDQLHGRFETRRRDVLLALELDALKRLKQLHPDQYADFSTTRDIYELLLIEVEMGPETQISYIKEGLNALQLYLQRARMRLESAVVQLDIPEAWWDWIMSIQTWQANRKIFLYPENYLLPSLRHDKTTLFKTLETDLRQQEVVPAYVETVYKTYLDGFAGLAKLKPIEAFRTRVADPRRGKIDATYLVARDDTDPYSFFICCQQDGYPWGEWEKIDLAIHSKYVTLAYAFDRLFLFWIVVKKTTGSAIELVPGGSKSTKSASYTVTVQYSFLNNQYKWVQPQTLITDFVVLFETDGGSKVSLLGDELFSDAFDMEDITWNKVYAMRLGGENRPGGRARPEDERLVIMFGPMMNSIYETDPKWTRQTGLTDAAATLAAQLYAQAQNHKRLLVDRTGGVLSVCSAYVVNGSLEQDSLSPKRELVAFDGYRPQAPTTIRADIVETNGAVRIAASAAAIVDSLLPGHGQSELASVQPTQMQDVSFASAAINIDQSKKIFPALKQAGIINQGNRVDPDKLAAANLHDALVNLLTDGTIHPIQLVEVQKALVGGLRAQQLFGAVAVPRARVTNVGNQPGWFLLDNGDEAFLLQPKVTDRLRRLDKPVFSPLDASIRLRPPPVHAGSFVMTGINAAMSVSILTAAKTAHLVDDMFQVDEDKVRSADFKKWPQTWLKDPTAKGLAADRMPLINNILLNAPIVFPDAFVSDRVDDAISRKIYSVLPEYNMVDEIGRLDTSVLTANNLNGLLGNLLRNSTISAKQMPGIYRALADTPSLLTASYVNDGDVTDYPTLADFKFSVTRVTTGAVGRLERALFTGGLDSLLDLKTQQIPVAPVMPFDRLQPSPTNLEFPKALDVAQVDFDGLYGRYYWEIFFHVPALIADSLAVNQRFQNARGWLHYIFNPTLTEQFVTDDVIVTETDGFIQKALAASIVTSLKTNKIIIISESVKAPVLDDNGRVHPKFTPELGLDFLKQSSLTDAMILRVRNILLNYQLSSPTAALWRFRPFRNQNIETLQDELSDGPAIAVYRSSPFDPFAIANLRIGAFEKAVVMQYIDILVKWGDMLFAQDNWESITAATMLYVYAYDLLGPRPQSVGACPTIAPVNYATLREKFGTVPEFLMALETLVPKSLIPKPAHGLVPVFNDLRTYFCIPENSRFRGCWDIVEDRLYKIRHSLNIKGEARQLALFEPALDPLMLAKMASAGSLQRRADEAAAQLPNYRFRFMLDRARNMVSSVTQLGGYLLAALEKRDAEQLALLRSTQDDQVLGLVTRVKQQQIADLEAGLAAMQASLQGAQVRIGHYQGLTTKGLIASEQVHLDAMAAGLVFNILAGILHTASAIGYAIPQAGSPFAMTYGGVQVGSMVQATAGAAELGSQVSNFIAQRAITMAGYERRQEDWSLQQATAEHDVGNITQQITALEARLVGARQDLAAHLRTIANNRETFDLLSRKFTNQDLYQWLVDHLSAIYFQSYRLAVDAAMTTQRAYQFELDSDATFVAFDYWDSLRKGLAAGEGLRLGLDQMEAAYVTNGVRLLEIEKTLSLALLDPNALLKLRTTGKCNFVLDERLFDYDFPGHYARKIKTVSLSVPALLGPYQQIKATLTQVKHAVAVTPDIEVVQYLLDPTHKKPDSQKLRETTSNGQSIALSRGVDDSGMFQLDFREERYLPFEGTGAVSSWTLEMPHETNRFDFEQLPDLLITLRYTARSDDTLRSKVENELAKVPYNSGLYLRTSQAYSPALQAFLQDHSRAGKQTLSFRFDVAAMRCLKQVTMTQLLLRIVVADPATPPTSPTFLSLTIDKFADVTNRPLVLKDGIAALDGLKWKQPHFENTWTLTFDIAAMVKDSSLTDGTWIDPARLIEIELIALYNGTIFAAVAA